MILVRKIIFACIFFVPLFSFAQIASDSVYVLQPDRVFDGEQIHEGWQVVIRNNKIEFAGLLNKQPERSKIIVLKGCTLLPGLIEGHSHLFLHPYNETLWNDQVLKESRAERVARALFMQKKHCLPVLQPFATSALRAQATMTQV